MSYSGTGQFDRVTAGSNTYTDSGLGLTRENTTSYVRDDRGLLLAQRAGSTHYYLLDGLGSVAALTDSTGNIAATYSYEPFGKVRASTGTVTNPWRFLGALGVYLDTATGLYKMGTRYYDPAVGRFTQVDPIEGGSANRYDYGGQDPINNVDLDGTVCVPCGIAVYIGVQVLVRVIAGALVKRALPRVIYSARVLAQRDVFHNLPRHVVNEVIRRGTITRHAGGYVQFTMRGTVNGRSGVFEIGGRFLRDGSFLLKHRFFRPF